MTLISDFIDRTTMYRLVLYYLLVLFTAALCFGAVGILPVSPGPLLWSTFILLAAAWLTNTVFAWGVSAVTNHESVFITPLILALILPQAAVADLSGTFTLAFISTLAMASKYLIAIGKKHLFNPAALAAVLASYLFGISATWWVAGNLPLLPFVLLGGLMVVHKLRKYDFIVAFFVTAFVAVSATSLHAASGLQALVLHSALFFLAFVMLTEPLTFPPTRIPRIIYGVIVGGLFVPAAHLGSFYFTPEFALLVGNLFSYFVSPKGRPTLTFVERLPLAEGIYEYRFSSERLLLFRPGQYLEWTLDRVPLDSRGNRRFFTIASAPGDTHLALGVRFYEKPSAFKRTLAALTPGAKVSATSLAGDFTLPSDTSQKVALFAGGIGVTPFASMARHMTNVGERRDAILLYSAKRDEEVAYRDVFSRAAVTGLRTTYCVGTPIDAERVRRELPDYRERLFYISGPHGFITAMKSLLINLGVSRSRIKTDFFPGLA